MSNDGLLSDDGRWRWDAAAGEWQPVDSSQSSDVSTSDGAVPAIPEEHVIAMMDAAEQPTQTA